MSGEEKRRRRRINDLQRVRLECHQDARNLQHACALDETLDDVAMPTMHTVERADGNHCAIDMRRQARLVG